MIKDVARQLGNTTAVCRKCYIHPAVLSGYLMGTLHADLGNIEVELEYPQVWIAERNVIRFLRSAATASSNLNGASHRNGARLSELHRAARQRSADKSGNRKARRHARA